MNALENKQVLQAAFAELGVSSAKPFVDLMADDFCWVCTGTTRYFDTDLVNRVLSDPADVSAYVHG